MTTDNNTHFSANEWQRYTRHIQLPQIGAKGQAQLKNSCALIIGTGGLGSPVSLYLAAAGVGHLIIIDHDQVDLTNLQRQILFDSEQIGQSKVIAARERLQSLNQDIQITAVDQAFTQDNSEKWIQQADIVIDCTDNFSSRYLINDLCKKAGKAWLYASIYQFSGQCALFTPQGPCFRCLFPQFPQNVEDCNAAGVLGVLPGLLGTIQANEAIKYLCGLPTPLEGHLLLVEALELQFQKIRLTTNPDCALCHSQQADPSFYQEAACAVAISEFEIDVAAFTSLCDSENSLLIDVRSAEEREQFHLGGLHIPLDQLAGKLDQLPENKTLLCYCQSGARSLDAAKMLQQLGLKGLSVSGGLAQILKRKKPASF